MQSDGVLELLLFEEIGDTGWGDGVTAKQIKQEIDGAAGRFSSIRVLVNSPGGDCWEGLSLAAILRAESARGIPVNCCVTGVAASAASIVMCAGTTVSLYAPSLVMIHNAHGIAMGDHTAHEEIADVLRKVDSSIVASYRRTKQPEAQLRKWMAAETWFSAEEALAAKFCDRIIENPAEQSTAMAMARGFQYNARHLPKSLRSAANAEACECDCENCVAGKCDECLTEDCHDAVCAENGCPFQTTEPETGNNTGAAHMAAFRARSWLARHGIRPGSASAQTGAAYQGLFKARTWLSRHGIRP
jgi:ATP-dependent protease ClpP protease subunit